MLDVLIIGAGPAGVQLGYFLQKKGFDFEILEQFNRVGSFFSRYPRHRMLISINKRFTGSENEEFNLRHDWNSLLSDNGPKFTSFDEKLFPCADNLMKYLDAFVDYSGINISFNTKVKSVGKSGDHFEVMTEDGRTIQARVVVVATGYTKPYIPDIKGIEHAIEYGDMSVDKNDYKNKRILIIGKGNSAFETADNLVDTAALMHLVSPEKLRFAWSSHYVGDLRAVNNNILDMYQLKSQHAMLDAHVKEIKPVEGGGYEATVQYLHAEGEEETMRYDIVLSCGGFRMGLDIFSDSCKPETMYHDKLPALKNNFESKNIEGLFFGGTLMHSLDYRKATSGFIHGFRYNMKALSEILDYRLHGKEIPSTKVDKNIEALGKAIIDRANVVSSIWQQPGFLSEYFQICDDEYRHYQALPLMYGIEDYFSKSKVITLTLEYGPQHGDVFSQERIARDNLNNSSKSNFLHPILRYYENGMQKSEFHVIEDLEAHWTYEEHLDHIAEYIASVG